MDTVHDSLAKGSPSKVSPEPIQEKPENISAGPSQYEEIANPFRLPSDEEVFVTREAEKRRTQELKEKQKQLRIWEKNTSTTHAPLKRPKETDIPPADFKEELGEGKGKERKGLIQKALDIVKERSHGTTGKDLGEKKQGMQDFVDQKKEMFLVVKTTKILNDERINLEKMADERQYAITLADKQMKKHKEEFMNKKQEQANETKRTLENLEAAIRRKQDKEEVLAQLEHDETNTRQRNKNNIEREENLWIYKQFHDKVANKEWLAQQPLEIMKKKWIEKKILSELPEKERGKKLADIDISEEKRAKLEEEFIRLVKENVITIENPDQTFPLYFEKADQLMEIFTLLEEQNLMLIQKNQGLLKEIEEKKASFTATKTRIEKRYKTLHENEQRLIEKNKDEEKRISEQIAIQESKEDQEIAKYFAEFKSMISQVYAEGVKSQMKSKVNTDVPTEKLIEYLTEIESRINEVHEKVGDNPNPAVLALQNKEKQKIMEDKTKKKDKEKEEKIQQAKLENARREKERALKKYVGKPIMKKTLLTKKVKKETKKLETNDEEQEFIKYFEP